MKLSTTNNTVATNRKAYHDYFVEDTYEAGVILTGCEVKSIRLGNLNLKDSYVLIRRDGTVVLCGMHVSPYDKGSFSNGDPRRDRLLLLNKSEIRKLRQKVTQKGYTLVPVRVYFKQALVKVEIALCRGKELHDKRESIALKDQRRAIEHATKEYGVQ